MKSVFRILVLVIAFVAFCGIVFELCKANGRLGF